MVLGSVVLGMKTHDFVSEVKKAYIQLYMQ